MSVSTGQGAPDLQETVHKWRSFVSLFIRQLPIRSQKSPRSRGLCHIWLSGNTLKKFVLKREMDLADSKALNLLDSRDVADRLAYLVAVADRQTGLCCQHGCQ